MRRAGGVAALVAVLACGALALSGQSASAPAPPDAIPLPVVGTQLGEFPPGSMKAVADQACLRCHSADMVGQQKLTEKQWTAEVTKMAGWGAAVPEDQKAALIAYLVEHFGPDNDRFQPVVARPAP
jgi:mono/diheme cytochrome c family protein